MGQITLWLCCARILCIECNLLLLFCKLFSITPSRPSPLRAGLQSCGSLRSDPESLSLSSVSLLHLRDMPSNAGPQCAQISHYGESYLRDSGPEETMASKCLPEAVAQRIAKQISGSVQDHQKSKKRYQSHDN